MEIVGLNRKNKYSDDVKTRFYGMLKKIYQNVFINTYQNANDKAGMWLKKAFYRKYCTPAVRCQALALYPDFSGQSGLIEIKYKMFRQMLARKNDCFSVRSLLLKKSVIEGKYFIWEEVKRH